MKDRQYSSHPAFPTVCKTLLHNLSIYNYNPIEGWCVEEKKLTMPQENWHGEIVIETTCISLNACDKGMNISASSYLLCLNNKTALAFQPKYSKQSRRRKTLNSK